MGENMYCGIGKIPKGKVRGTPEYCVQTNQIRYYGLEEIDEKLLKQAKRKRLKRNPLVQKPTKNHPDQKLKNIKVKKENIIIYYLLKINYDNLISIPILLGSWLLFDKIFLSCNNNSKYSGSLPFFM